MARVLIVVAGIVAAAACAVPTPEERFTTDAADALGGRGRLLALRTIDMEGEGRQLNLGQDMTWEAEGQHFTLSPFRRALSLVERRVRTEQVRTPNFLYFQGPQPQRQIVGLDGDVAYTIGPNDTAARASAAAARDRLVDLYHFPAAIVRAMLDGVAPVANVRSEGNGRSADVTLAGATFVLSLDAAGVPESVSSPGQHANLGDVTITTTFGGYTDVDGVRLPARLTTRTDGRVTSEISIRRFAIDGDAGDLAAPASVAAAPPPAPPAPLVEATELARGVWWLAGQSHHSALVEFADHTMLIEAPQSEARTLAVIAKARELVPGRPLRRLVMSHHHFDHTAGLRAAIAEGLGVIAHKSAAAFVEEMATRPHTRQPDALQTSPRPVTVEPVDDALVLKDAAMTVELYHIAGNPHADTLLMAYLPRERLLIEVDAFSPGGSYHPYAANLLEQIRARTLRVDRIVPLHGSVVPFAELVKAVETR
ncbi:MAG: MBL fold metallo-hydrolase [Acidobacteriota bacterium]